MSEQNKAILKKGNEAIVEGNYEGFLSLCSDDTEWTFVGDKTLKGKEAVRQWMATTYLKPPKVIIDSLVAENDFLIAIGTVTMIDKDGKEADYAYCDAWHIKDGKFAGLKAFVIKNEHK